MLSPIVVEVPMSSMEPAAPLSETLYDIGKPLLFIFGSVPDIGLLYLEPFQDRLLKSGKTSSIA